MASPIRFAWLAQRQALPIVLQIKPSQSSSHAEPRASLPLPAYTPVAAPSLPASHTHKPTSVNTHACTQSVVLTGDF